MDQFLNKELEILQQKTKDIVSAYADPAHDFSHILRVYRMAEHLCEVEGGDPSIALPAALLHDLYQVPKNHPERAAAAEKSAVMAERMLKEISYPNDKIPFIMLAIRSHSFSRGETPTTKEAMIVQDADRLDAIGAIGIARLWVTGAQFNRQLYSPEDPFCENGREPDDLQYSIDHFYQKLLKIKDRLMTEEARRIAEERHAFLVKYVGQLRRELLP